MLQRSSITCLFLILSACLFIQAINCPRPYIAPEKFAARCPVIIQGNIISIEGPYKEHAMIYVSKIYKNTISDLTITSGQKFTVHMTPTGKQWENSTDIRYCLGTDGIWLITLNPDSTFSITEHPVQRQCSSAEKELRKKGVFKNPGKKLYSKKEWLEHVNEHQTEKLR